MLKQIISFLALIALSVLVLIGMPYAQQGVQFILSAHNWIADTLTTIFSGGDAGNLVRNLIALLIIPIAISFIPAIIYWLAKRKWFPYFLELIWVLWLIQTSALVVLYQAAAA